MSFTKTLPEKKTTLSAKVIFVNDKLLNHANLGIQRKGTYKGDKILLVLKNKSSPNGNKPNW